MKISWASTVVVLIGKETHSRPWVNWEIGQANKQGKRIVGVYARGATEADKPAALEKYARPSLVGTRITLSPPLMAHRMHLKIETARQEIRNIHK